MHILLIALLVLALVGLIVAFPQPRQRSRYAPMATSRRNANATGPASGLRVVEGGTDGDKWDACTGTNGRAQDSPRAPQNAA